MWSLLFLLVPLGATGSVVMAALNMPPLDGMWVPTNQNPGETRVDSLVVSLHVVSAVVLMGTGLVLAGIMWSGTRPGIERARYLTHNTGLEILWSVVPAGILVWLALSQYAAWSDMRLERPVMQIADGSTRNVPPLIRVYARRFAWEFHHAGADAVVGTADDVIALNELVVPAGQDVVLEMISRDVIHNFCVPSLRLKQDIVPGLKQLIWFQTRVGYKTDIVCTELCGWGHYLMQARLRSVSPEEYAAWIQQHSLSTASESEAAQ